MLTGLSQHEAIMNALLGYPIKTNSYNFKTSSNKETERMQRKFFALGVCWDTYGYEIKFLDNRRFCRKGNNLYPWHDSNLVMVDIEDFIGKEDKKENKLNIQELNINITTNNDNESVEMQKILFKHGITWRGGKKIVAHYSCRRFCIKNGILERDNRFNWDFINFKQLKSLLGEKTMELKDLRFKVVIPFEKQVIEFQELLFKKGGRLSYIKPIINGLKDDKFFCVDNLTLSTFDTIRSFNSNTRPHYSIKQAMKLLNKLPDANICPFEDGEIVLMRDDNVSKWMIGCFNTNGCHFNIAVNDEIYVQVIKYKGNEHHINTTTNLKHWEKLNGKYILKD